MGCATQAKAEGFWAKMLQRMAGFPWEQEAMASDLLPHSQDKDNRKMQPILALQVLSDGKHGVLLYHQRAK